MLTGILLVSLGVQVAVWAVWVAASFWLYRRAEFRSAPWLLTFLLLYLPLSTMLPYGLRGLLDSEIPARLPPPFGWTVGELVAAWSYSRAFLEALMYLILSILLLADVTFLLQRNGIVFDSRLAQLVLQGRANSARLGTALVVLILVAPAAMLCLWIYAFASPV